MVQLGGQPGTATAQSSVYTLLNSGALRRGRASRLLAAGLEVRGQSHSRRSPLPCAPPLARGCSHRRWSALAALRLPRSGLGQRHRRHVCGGGRGGPDHVGAGPGRAGGEGAAALQCWWPPACFETSSAGIGWPGTQSSPTAAPTRSWWVLLAGAGRRGSWQRGGRRRAGRQAAARPTRLRRSHAPAPAPARLLPPCQARKMLGRKASTMMSIMLILYSFGAGALRWGASFGAPAAAALLYSAAASCARRCTAPAAQLPCRHRLLDHRGRLLPAYGGRRVWPGTLPAEPARRGCSSSCRGWVPPALRAPTPAPTCSHAHAWPPHARAPQHWWTSRHVVVPLIGSATVLPLSFPQSLDAISGACAGLGGLERWARVSSPRRESQPRVPVQPGPGKRAALCVAACNPHATCPQPPAGFSAITPMALACVVCAIAWRAWGFVHAPGCVPLRLSKKPLGPSFCLGRDLLLQAALILSGRALS